MATTHEEKTRKGQSYIGAYVPKELADRIDRIALSYRRSEFVRRALEREAERMEEMADRPEVKVGPGDYHHWLMTEGAMASTKK